MRAIGIAVVAALVGSAAAADTSWNPIDLDRPGALEQVKRESPTQYDEVVGILRSAERMPCKPRAVRSLEARFDIEEMACNITLMTSYPPKRRLGFAVNGTGYTATVTMKDAAGRLVPANGGQQR